MVLYNIPTFQQTPYFNGASTPRDSAIASQNSQNTTQANLINVVGGSRKRRRTLHKKRGKKGKRITFKSFFKGRLGRSRRSHRRMVRKRMGGGTIVVPSNQPMYPEQVAPHMGVSAITQNMLQTYVNHQANSVYDGNAKEAPMYK